jgi:hypothetical protein
MKSYIWAQSRRSIPNQFNIEGWNHKKNQFIIIAKVKNNNKKIKCKFNRKKKHTEEEIEKKINLKNYLKQNK